MMKSLYLYAEAGLSEFYVGVGRSRDEICLAHGWPSLNGV